MTFYDVALSGTVSSDGKELGGINYRMSIDIAELVSVMNVSDTETLCEHAENLGSSCGPCPDGSSDTCTTVSARGLLGETAMAPVVPVEVNNKNEDCL